MQIPARRLKALRGLLMALCLLLVAAPVTLASASLESKPAPGVQKALDASAPVTVTATGPSCRYGVALLASHHISALEPLNAGWYLDFGTQAAPGPSSVEYAPVIRVRQHRVGCTRLPSYSIYPPLTDSGLGAAIRSRPGSLWIFGNEPDRGPNPEDTDCSDRSQDDTSPDVYARAYFDAYHYIKRLDPTARVANAGLVQVTPGRLQYLDIVWSTYRSVYGADMPVDVWNMHLYILPEARPNGEANGVASIAIGTDPALAIRESSSAGSTCSPSDADCWKRYWTSHCGRQDVYCWAEHDDMKAFAEQVVAMRRWMKDHGQQEKQLIISEYSLLYAYVLDDPADPTSCYLKDEFGKCFTPDRVANFLNNSMSYLETAADSTLGNGRDGNRLVQRWLWFGTSARAVGKISDLTDPSGTQQTLVGNAFSARAGAAARTVNLVAAAASGRPGMITTGEGTGNALLTAEVRNQGTAAINQEFTASFYRDEGLNDLIGSVNLASGLMGCDSRGILAQKTWSSLSPGWHSFWVKVDADGVVDETWEDDNLIEGRVFIATHQLKLPLIHRAVPR